MNQHRKKVIIVGAGLAGLSCANHLLSQFDVYILEASESIGGRVKTLEQFAEVHLEAGGEEIHFKETPFYEMCVKAGAKLILDEDENLQIYNPVSKKMMDFKKFQELYPKEKNIEEYFHDESSNWEQDKSCKEAAKELNQEMNHWFNFVSCDYGSLQEELSAQQMGKSFKDYQDSYNYIIENKDLKMIDIVTSTFSNVLPYIKYNSQVTSISQDNNSVTAKFNCDQQVHQITADYLVCTVPFNILTQIYFQPFLPDDKIYAFSKIKMALGGKLFLKFKSPVMGDQHFISIFKTQYPICGFWKVHSSKHQEIWDSVINEESYKALKNIGLDQFVKNILAEIEPQIGQKLINHFEEAHFEDWAANPFIQGLYSHPKVGANDSRKTIAKPFGRVYFGGEACHTKFFATMHGAVETGLIAAMEILKIETDIEK